MGGIPTHGPITTSRVKCLNFVKNFTHKIKTLWLKYNSKQSHWMHGMLANKNAWYGQHNQLWDCNVKLSQCQYCHHWSSQKNKNMTRDFRMKTSCTTLTFTHNTPITHIQRALKLETTETCKPHWLLSTSLCKGEGSRIPMCSVPIVFESVQVTRVLCCFSNLTYKKESMNSEGQWKKVLDYILFSAISASWWHHNVHNAVG